MLLEEHHTADRDMAPKKPKRNLSLIEEFTVLDIGMSKEETTLTALDLDESTLLTKGSLVILGETGNLEALLLSAPISDFQFITKIKVEEWDGKKMHSDFIKEGLIYNNKLEASNNTIMLFESPTSSAEDCSFHNRDNFHEWPPAKSTKSKSTQSKSVLGSCLYSLMNGSAFPAFLRDGAPPAGLMEHWAKAVPGIPAPHFVSKVTEKDTVNAHLPVEQIKNHVNDPDVHYHLVGKDAIHLMTQKTTNLLPDTSTTRPCVVKTTHSMGSKGTFIITNDKQEAEFEQFLVDYGDPTFVVTDFDDIVRKVTCHFFMHPNGKDVTWFGCDENVRIADGRFSTDSYLIMKDQDLLKKMQMPFVEEVVQYCQSLGFWGFCGIEVFFDSQKRGYLADISPSVSHSCPALMTLNLFQKKYGFTVGLFRCSGDTTYFGTPTDLLKQVTAYNTEQEGYSRIVIHSMFEPQQGALQQATTHSPTKHNTENEGSRRIVIRTKSESKVGTAKVGTTKVNIGVYGNDIDECKAVLKLFAKPAKAVHSKSVVYRI
jgi:hypothetical protein